MNMSLRLSPLLLLACALSACGRPEPASSSSQERLEPEHGDAQVHAAGRMEGTTTVDSGSDGAAPRRSPPPPAAPRPPTEDELTRYPWLSAEARVRPLEAVFAPPSGFERVDAAPGSFGEFLRGLPLRPDGSDVHTYRGALLRAADHPGVAAVAELDVSPTDVQQCADSVIRLHAEWKWSRGEQSGVGYHFLSGDYAAWTKYASGARAVANGKGIRWAQSAKASSDHATYRKYLDMVFNYASTISLHRSSSTAVEREDLAPGDFFILPGGPGHAILILDVAKDASGKRVALLGQGFMPAQDFHVLRPLQGPKGAWFSLEGDAVDTPFWPEPFPWSSLRRMKNCCLTSAAN